MSHIKRISILLLCAALSFSSCSSSTQGESAQPASTEPYRAELCRTVDDLDKNVIHAHSLSETCYYFSEEDNDQIRIMRYGIKDTSLDQTVLSLERPEILLDFSVNTYNEIAVAIWHSLSDENQGKTNNLLHGLELRKYDESGILLWSLEVPDVENPSSFRGITLGDNGSLAFCLSDTIRIYQNTGKLQICFSLSKENAGQLLLMEPNMVFVLYSNAEEIYAEQYDAISGKLLSEKSLSGYRHLFGHGEKLYYVDNGDLGIYDREHNTPIPLSDLTMAGIDISCLSAITETEEDIFMIGQWNTSGTALKLFRLAPCTQEPITSALPNAESIPAQSDTAAESEGDAETPTETPPQELIFAILNRDSFQGSVVNFNRTNTAYNVQFKPFSFDQLDMLNAALATNSEIDLVEITGRYAYNDYIANDYLLDLAPFLESSGKLSLESFIEPVTREFLQDGKIYVIPRSITVGTLACPSSLLNGQTSWTVDEFLTLMTQYPNAFSGDGRSVVETREKLLRTVLYRGLNGFVDIAGGKSRLEEEDFQNVLYTIQALPISASNLSLEERAANSEMVFWEILNLQNTRTLQQLEWRSGEELTLIGYPVYDNAEGESSGGLIGFGDFVGIHSTSQHPDGAWLYLEQYLSGALTVSSSGFTTGREAFEEKLTEDMGADYEEYLLEGIPYPAITFRQSEKVRTAFETAFYYTETQQAIVALILEEAESYFLGEKSLEDTVKIMDNRVQLYLDETR